MASVELKGIVKSYQTNIPVVHGIDLEIKDGEFMVLVGPSGCGKSTTLRMIAGLEEITDGELTIAGKVVNDVAPKDRNIAMVFQNYALYPHMNVYENIAFGLKLAKLPKEEIDIRVKGVAKNLEIEHLLDRKPKNMSGGQRQRVALGRAIARRSSVYLFDEPLSNLDAQLRVSMRVRLAQLHSDLAKQGLENTMIYVTHDQIEAMTLGHRICVMEDGYIRQVDTPLNLYKYPANKFVAEFIGSPSMNFTDGTIEKSGDKYIVDINGYKCTISEEKSKMLADYVGKKVGIGVRSEDIHCVLDDASLPKADISVTEHMGNEEFIYFNYNNSLFVCRSKENLNITRESKNCHFKFEEENLHIFDLETELNISIPTDKIDHTHKLVDLNEEYHVPIVCTALGGKENITDLTHCISRLRFTINDLTKLDRAALTKLNLNVIYSSENQVHIVLGKNTKNMYEIFSKLVK